MHSTPTNIRLRLTKAKHKSLAKADHEAYRLELQKELITQKQLNSINTELKRSVEPQHRTPGQIISDSLSEVYSRLDNHT